MDIFYKKIAICFFIVALGHTLHAQEKVSKKITHDFPMTNAGEFKLENKYGNVNVYGWDKNSTTITIEISVSHKKKDNANDLLARINPKVTHMDDLVDILFEITQKNKSFFNKYFNKANPFDLDRSNVQINYTIYLPKSAELNITNKFGDVIIEDWNGKLKGDVQHGDMWINKDLNNVDLDIKYGKLRAKSINYGNIRLKNGTFDMESAEDLRINSGGTTITIEKVSSLEIYSSKDVVIIEEAGKLHGNLKYSDLRVERLTEDVNLTMKLAEFRVAKILNNEAVIILDQISSEISLNVAGFGLNFDATLEEGLLRLPKSFANVNSEMIDKGKRIRKITATYGNKLSGKVSITGHKGAILLKD